MVPCTAITAIQQRVHILEFCEHALMCLNHENVILMLEMGVIDYTDITVYVNIVFFRVGAGRGI